METTAGKHDFGSPGGGPRNFRAPPWGGACLVGVTTVPTCEEEEALPATEGEGDTLSGGDRIGMGTGAGSASSVLRRSTWGEVGELRSSWWCQL